MDDKRKRFVRIQVLKALMYGTITKDEAKTILNAGEPSKYMWPVYKKEGKEEYIRIKLLMERLKFFPKVRFTSDDY